MILHGGSFHIETATDCAACDASEICTHFPIKYSHISLLIIHAKKERDTDENN
jgi:hypothetical protein